MNLGSTILGIVIIFSGFSLAYFGFFNKIEIEIREVGGGIIIFEEVRGGYDQTAIAEEKLYFSLRSEFGVESRKGYSRYQVSPKEAEINNSISEAGVFLEKEHLDRFVDLEENFNIKRIDNKQYITADFPLRAGVSSLIGSRKVYSALDDFVEVNGYERDTSVIEIEDKDNGIIRYLKEIQKL